MNGYEVCKLKRSSFGLKQALREWNSEFTSQLTKYGFVQSQNDHCLFILKIDNVFTILLVYVDDVLFTGNCSNNSAGQAFS